MILKNCEISADGLLVIIIILHLKYGIKMHLHLVLLSNRKQELDWKAESLTIHDLEIFFCMYKLY